MSEETQQEIQGNTAEPVNPNTPSSNSPFNYGFQHALPNATPVLVLGILSIVTCCCYGAIGLVLSIVALVLSKKDRALYANNISLYTESSFKNLNAGRVCAIIGLILNLLVILFYISLIVVFGWGILSDPNAMREIMESYQ